MPPEDSQWLPPIRKIAVLNEYGPAGAKQVNSSQENAHCNNLALGRLAQQEGLVAHSFPVGRANNDTREDTLSHTLAESNYIYSDYSIDNSAISSVCSSRRDSLFAANAAVIQSPKAVAQEAAARQRLHLEQYPQEQAQGVSLVMNAEGFPIPHPNEDQEELIVEAVRATVGHPEFHRPDRILAHERAPQVMYHPDTSRDSIPHEHCLGTTYTSPILPQEPHRHQYPQQQHVPVQSGFPHPADNFGRARQVSLPETHYLHTQLPQQPTQAFHRQTSLEAQASFQRRHQRQVPLALFRPVSTEYTQQIQQQSGNALAAGVSTQVEQAQVRFSDNNPPNEGRQFVANLPQGEFPVSQLTREQQQEKAAKLREKEEKIRQLDPSLAVHVWARHTMDTRISERFSAFSKMRSEEDNKNSRHEAARGVKEANGLYTDVLASREDKGTGSEVGLSPSSSSNIPSRVTGGSNGVNIAMGGGPPVAHLAPATSFSKDQIMPTSQTGLSWGERVQGQMSGRDVFERSNSDAIRVLRKDSVARNHLQRSASASIEPVNAQQLTEYLNKRRQDTPLDFGDLRQAKKITRRATEPLNFGAQPAFDESLQPVAPTLDEFIEQVNNPGHLGNPLSGDQARRLGNPEQDTLSPKEEMTCWPSFLNEPDGDDNDLGYTPARDVFDPFQGTFDNDFARLDSASPPYPGNSYHNHRVGR